MGSWLESAERRIESLDPQPDLDNANVGRCLEKEVPAHFLIFLEENTCGSSLFYFIGNSRRHDFKQKFQKEKDMDRKNRNLTKKVAMAGVLTALAVVGSMLSFPVAGSKCAPVQHMVNILAAVLMGPAWSAGIAFCASLLRNLLGLGSLMAFPGSMVGALVCGLVFAGTKNLKLTCVGEAFGTGVLGGLAAWPVAKFLMGAEPAGLITVLEKGGVVNELSFR